MHAHAMPLWSRCDPRALALRAMTGRRGGGHGPRHRHHGHWGGGMPFGGGPFGRPRRMRRGDVRAALLLLLAEEPRNGYGLIREIEARSDGVWRPSPGSVYPALAQLEDEGLVRSEERDGGKRFTLTDAGREHVEAHRDELGEPWATATAGVDEGALELRDLVWQTAAAAQQVAHAGNARQIARARQVLADTRRSLYRILAEDDEPGPGEDEDATA